MSWLEFIAAMASAVAWPLVVTFLGILFRQQIKLKLSQVKKIKAGDWEVEMGHELAEVREAIKGGPPVRPAIDASTDPQYRSLRASVDNQIQLAVATTPVAAIPLAWTLLESELNAVARRVGAVDPVSSEAAPTVIVRQLRDEHLIEPGFANALEQLWRMKKRAEIVQATGQIVSAEDARTYVKAAVEAADRLHGLATAA
ncbi:MAG TPA: hypothetical protein VGF69_10420 [Thermoanaerobaculia bacterium]|jgi:hypothetical protein